MPISAPTRRDGTPWDPKFIEAINEETCIGCGRCYKVCTHGVLAMMGMTEDDDLVPADDDEAERMVMTIAAKGRCIGCEACVQVCGSKSITLISAAEALAA
ncbi:MAG: ferredoxin III, nif-specific [Rhodospirillales bacterium]|nr:ferredoxin III, nif-specific [Rhodospirillales bacterium]